jgi:3-hydroxyisobutyrate dehydrogenase
MTAAPLDVLFVGLGTMGRPMATRLAAGRPEVRLRLQDVDADAVAATAEATGGVAADDASAASATVVFLSLPNSAIVAAALGSPDDPASLVRRLPEGAIVVDMSSSDPERTRALAESIAPLGVRLVDAPVSGGPSKAATGELTIMVGGDDEAVARIHPLLEAMGANIFHVGGVGAAHALKALNNLLSLIGIVGSLEVLATGIRFGLDPSVMLDVINVSTGRNQATEVKIGPQVLDAGWNVGFSLELTVKDVTTALALADSTGVPSPVSAAAVETAREAFELLRAEGRPDQSEIAKLVAERAGVDFRRRP